MASAPASVGVQVLRLLVLVLLMLTEMLLRLMMTRPAEGSNIEMFFL
jgi:hypothetical protein